MGARIGYAALLPGRLRAGTAPGSNAVTHYDGKESRVYVEAEINQVRNQAKAQKTNRRGYKA
jgi:hypothetical protein